MQVMLCKRLYDGSGYAFLPFDGTLGDLDRASKRFESIYKGKL